MTGGQALFVLFGFLTFAKVFCGEQSLNTGMFCVDAFIALINYHLTETSSSVSGYKSFDLKLVGSLNVDLKGRNFTSTKDRRFPTFFVLLWNVHDSVPQITFVKGCYC